MKLMAFKDILCQCLQTEVHCFEFIDIYPYFLFIFVLCRGPGVLSYYVSKELLSRREHLQYGLQQF